MSVPGPTVSLHGRSDEAAHSSVPFHSGEMNNTFLKYFSRLSHGKKKILTMSHLDTYFIFTLLIFSSKHLKINDRESRYFLFFRLVC